MMTEASINFNGSHNDVIVGHMKVESAASTPPQIPIYWRASVLSTAFILGERNIMEQRTYVHK